MLGMIGLIGCIAGIVCGAVSAAVAIAGMAYSIHSSIEQEAQVERMDARNLENQKRSELLQKAQQRKSLIRAAQMAASGSLLDRIRGVKAKRDAQKARERASRIGNKACAIPLPSRDYGSPIVSNNYK